MLKIFSFLELLWDGLISKQNLMTIVSDIYSHWDPQTSGHMPQLRLVNNYAGGADSEIRNRCKYSILKDKLAPT